MTGTILVFKQRDTYSEVHFIDCSVIWGEVMAGQRAYDDVLVVSVETIDDDARLALALRDGADGREPRLQPCCLPISEDGGWPVMEGVEEVMAEVIRENPGAFGEG